MTIGFSVAPAMLLAVALVLWGWRAGSRAAPESFNGRWRSKWRRGGSANPCRDVPMVVHCWLRSMQHHVRTSSEQTPGAQQRCGPFSFVMIADGLGMCSMPWGRSLP